MSADIVKLASRLDAVELAQDQEHLSPDWNVQPFDHLLVLDFEATCWNRNERKTKKAEIIEFPCVLYDIRRGTILAEFQQYVMPTENPVLSSFCQNLTGISQTQVENGVSLGTCLILFQEWLRQQTVLHRLTPRRYISVTWSDWDLGMYLRQECQRKNLKRAAVFRKWIDAKELYEEHYTRLSKGLSHSMMRLGLHFEGTPHCGLHDARNTAKLVERLVADGCRLRITSPKKSYN